MSAEHLFKIFTRVRMDRPDLELAIESLCEKSEGWVCQIDCTEAFRTKVLVHSEYLSLDRAAQPLVEFLEGWGYGKCPNCGGCGTGFMPGDMSGATGDCPICFATGYVKK